MDGWSSSDDDKWHRAGNPYPEGYDKNCKIDGYEVDSDDAYAEAKAEAEQDLTFLGMRVALNMCKVPLLFYCGAETLALGDFVCAKRSCSAYEAE
eukprot:3939631-Rhodomonas_salina.1